MSRSIVVSNRVGDIENPTQTGGLAVAMADALRTHGGLWFGCASEPSATGPATVETGSSGVGRVTVPLSKRAWQNYYVGYSNSVLWPLLHYRTDLIRYRDSYYRAYLDVNRHLAEQLLPLLRPGDLVWVHDYHLLPFARFLRQAGAADVRIGFFLHTPFPPREVFAASPNNAELIDAMLDYDLVGFQTTTDLANFHHNARDHASPVGPDNVVRSNGRVTLSGCFPISIDVEEFGRMASAAEDDVLIERMRRHILKRKQIVGVDRLDYSKGIPDRFEAFEKLLTSHPEMEARVSLLQISPPTREGIKAYTEIRQVTEGLAGAINGRFADFNWTPIRYIHRSVKRNRLASILRSSDVGLVTPLRDGMNLVAKEYVAAQDPDDPGVLVLSQFAGAAEEMAEALIVNPHDIDEMARCLHQALTMPLDERKERHDALYRRIASANVGRWASAFLDALEGRSAEPAAGGRIPDFDKETEVLSGQPSGRRRMAGERS